MDQVAVDASSNVQYCMFSLVLRPTTDQFRLAAIDGRQQNCIFQPLFEAQTRRWLSLARNLSTPCLIPAETRLQIQERPLCPVSHLVSSPKGHLYKKCYWKEKRKFDRSKICVKCKTNSGNLLIRHSIYCRCGHLLRSFIRRHRKPEVFSQGLLYASRNHKVSPSARTSHKPRLQWTTTRRAQAVWWSARSILRRSWILSPTRPRTQNVLRERGERRAQRWEGASPKEQGLEEDSRLLCRDV